MSLRAFLPRLAMLALAPIIFVGCSTRTIPAAALLLSAHVTGKVHGGAQPVNGATIQLFDVTVNPGTAIPLISSTVTTDSGGNFGVTGLYTCAAPSDQIYLTAQGGDPGSGVNSNLILMTALGNCGDLSSATGVSVNEVTTVATIYAYAGFFDPTQAQGLYITGGGAPEYAFFLTLVNPATGVALTTSNPNSPNILNALANSITPCVNQASSAGDTPACDSLIAIMPPYGVATPSDDAVGIYLIAVQPDYNPAAIFNLAPGSPPFQPTLASSPAGWEMM